MPTVGMGQAKFERDGQSGAADKGPGGNMGKNMGGMKPKQAKFGNKPDGGGSPATREHGLKSDSAYSRSGGQIA